MLTERAERAVLDAEEQAGVELGDVRHDAISAVRYESTRHLVVLLTQQVRRRQTTIGHGLVEVLDVVSYMDKSHLRDSNGRLREVEERAQVCGVQAVVTTRAEHRQGRDQAMGFAIDIGVGNTATGVETQVHDNRFLGHFGDVVERLDRSNGILGIAQGLLGADDHGDGQMAVFEQLLQDQRTGDRTSTAGQGEDHDVDIARCELAQDVRNVLGDGLVVAVADCAGTVEVGEQPGTVDQAVFEVGIGGVDEADFDVGQVGRVTSFQILFADVYATATAAIDTNFAHRASAETLRHVFLLTGLFGLL
ncbi:hypothetical protein D3C86_1326100 [compost metagenome]